MPSTHKKVVVRKITRDTISGYVSPASFVSEGKLRVYQTMNAGKKWEALTRGLPQKNALETILRDGLATDTLRPAGIYFGTRSGKVFGSNNDGKSWNLILEGLPPVTCVKTALVGEGEGRGMSARKATSSAKRKSARPKLKSKPKTSAGNKRSTGRRRVAAR